MRKGFTLLELIVVIIVLGILATLGLTQYGRTIERSRGAEARNILGTMRTLAAGLYMEAGTASGLTDAVVGIGTGNDQSPGPALANCRQSHYFFYSQVAGATTPSFTATRCSAGGKPPQFAGGPWIRLEPNLNTGIDTWNGNGGY